MSTIRGSKLPHSIQDFLGPSLARAGTPNPTGVIAQQAKDPTGLKTCRVCFWRGASAQALIRSQRTLLERHWGQVRSRPRL